MRIFLVEDHPLFRRGLTELIEREENLSVCGSVATTAKARRLLRETSADLVIVDLILGSDSGLELIQELCSASEIKVLVVSSREESIFAERALRAGAMGFVGKSEEPQTILAAIRFVLRGEVYVSPSIAQKMLRRNVGRDDQPSTEVTNSLTNRELQVFEQIGRGLSTVAIADAMHLSRKTVESYRDRIREKLAVTSLNDLIRQAVLWTDRQDRAS